MLAQFLSVLLIDMIIHWEHGMEFAPWLAGGSSDTQDRVNIPSPPSFFWDLIP